MSVNAHYDEFKLNIHDILDKVLSLSKIKTATLPFYSLAQSIRSTHFWSIVVVSAVGLESFNPNTVHFDLWSSLKSCIVLFGPLLLFIQFVAVVSPGHILSLSPYSLYLA